MFRAFFRRPTLPGRRRPRAVALLATTLLLTGTAAVLPPAASGAEPPPLPVKTLSRSSWAFTDAADPFHVKVDAPGDAPVGARLDATGPHVSRSYYTLDLSSLLGKHVVAAALTVPEKRAADCAHRALELWSTAPVTAKSSWAKPPAELTRLATAGTPESGCPADLAALDLTAALAKAVQAGEKTLTLELRVPAAHELDPRYGRWFAADVSLRVTYNTPPGVPANLRTEAPDAACATTAPGVFARVSNFPVTGHYAEVADPDAGQELVAHWEMWSVDDPSVRRDLDWPVTDGKAYAQFDNPGLPPDRTYAWRLRVTDGLDTSAWSPTCYLTPDSVAPEVPDVTSEVYLTDSPWDPRGGIGVPGQFTFTAHGSADVVRYEYRFGDQSGWTSVPAEPLGGPATVTFTPRDSGSFSVAVRSVDRANNYSYERYRSFTVRDIRPYVWSTLYPPYSADPDGNVGVPGVFDLSPGLPDTVSYGYHLEHGPEQTVAADAEGKAHVTLAPAHGGQNVLYVRNTGADGTVSLYREYKFDVDTAPNVTWDGSLQIGSATTFRLTPRLAGTTSYTAWFTGYQDAPIGDPITVPARADGTAAFGWTPPKADSVALRVRSTDAAGTQSEVRYTSLYVDGAAPSVTRTGGADAPGEPGTFTFRSTLKNTAEFVYWPSTDPTHKLTAPARPDGTAEVTWTPTEAGNVWFTAQARNTSGVPSAEGSTSFVVYDSPVVTSADFRSWPYGPMLPGSFRLTTRLAGTVAFEFAVDSYTTTDVPARPDGTADVGYTPSTSGYHTVYVRARAADGKTSGWNYYSFTVTDRPLVSSADYPGGQAGGPGVAGTFTFAPGAPGTTAYVYHVHDDYRGTDEPEQTVPVDAGGKASMSWTPQQGGSYTVTVQGRKDDGSLTEAAYYTFSVAYRAAAPAGD
ncbi:hypothetical protein [Amycolatopsis australiensis]|uniref:PKD domain-containing protein n=1 Tax=Amycolatopsis australiensis TaxID=546364 RepID=A0A1K1S1K4_9PSEU|nr:hypothetical protein [Amycolatopsis australiensis]SFW78233.1 hypothetical protein SAMN04489730_4475 [Amycolatopsis australiensis]